MENLSLKLNYFKKKLKLTNKKIAILANLPVATVERISSGRTQNPNLKTLKALANVFECSLDDLMNLKDTTKPYYLDEQTAKIANSISGNETLKTLFVTINELSDIDKQAVVGFAIRLKSMQDDKKI